MNIRFDLCDQDLGNLEHLTQESAILSLIPGQATYFLSPSADSRAIVSYWENVHLVLVNRLGGLSCPGIVWSG